MHDTCLQINRRFHRVCDWKCKIKQGDAAVRRQRRGELDQLSTRAQSFYCVRTMKCICFTCCRIYPERAFEYDQISGMMSRVPFIMIGKQTSRKCFKCEGQVDEEDLEWIVKEERSWNEVASCLKNKKEWDQV